MLSRWCGALQLGLIIERRVSCAPHERWRCQVAGHSGHAGRWTIIPTSASRIACRTCPHAQTLSVNVWLRSPSGEGHFTGLSNAGCKILQVTTC